ncbi:sensor histidine kinase [Aequorivita capsosiphonis]|uniref:sensor histidine kinase n=1 Tax=Aequorivita capsosiphonis TaxID=487317 RepID=UPI00041315F5|nr:sensor histidine kinase [Aequorivita capsosiphonis]
MKALFLALFFLWNCTLAITAQQYQFKKYKVEEGLVSNETYDIIQDSKNRIWISTVAGISCFNGKTFKNYTTDDGLASNASFSLFEDSRGRIWVGSHSKGVSIIENGKVTRPQGLDFSSMGSVNSYLEAEDGTIYIFFLRSIVSYKNGKWNILMQDTEEDGSSDLQIAAWYDSNTIYITSLSKSVFKLTLNPYKLENIYTEKDGINNICYSILIDKEKNIWVGAYGGLYKIVNGNITYYDFNPDEFDKNRVYDIYEENENEFYLSFEGNGFGIFNKTSGNIKIYNEQQGLPSKYIYRTIKDVEGNHWMTSYGEGIIRFRDTSFKIYNEEQGLPSNNVNDLAEWDNEWVLATDDGAVTINENKEIRQLTKKEPVTNLFVSPENTLLLSTESEVLEFSKDAPPKVIDQGVYNLLFKDKKGTFLFETKRIKVLTEDSTYFIKSKRSIDIKPIGDRYILCKIAGLFQIKENRMDTIPGLSYMDHHDFRSIDVINKNEVIAGSEKKLYHIKLEDDDFKIQIFDMSRFPLLTNFRALKVDGNDLWLAGRNMFYKTNLELLLTKDSISEKHYNTVANFLENDIDFNSLLITKDKTILASSFSGIIAFNEKDYIPNTQPPKLELSDIRLFSESIDESLYKSANGIVLPYQKNYLSFSMEAITFTNPENVHYQYRMKGLRDGDEWSLPTKDPNVVFSYLPPGEYTFEFIASNGNAIWQETPSQYSFTIKLPFWRTSLFWFSLLSFISASILLFIHYKNKAKQKRNEAYAHNLIKAQEEERTRVARELHDSVGQKLMLLTKKTKSIGNSEMESLAGNTLEELRTISRGLHPANLERLGVTAAIRTLIDEVDANTNIFFTYEIENIDTLLSKEASLHLYRIIQEVLNNMVKHAETKSASINIEKKGLNIETVISDNGKGFEHSEKIKSSASLGMKTLLERSKILHSKIDIKSQINQGTTVTLITPI